MASRQGCCRVLDGSVRATHRCQFWRCSWLGGGAAQLGSSAQIALIDIAFSLDSAIVAIGLAEDVGAMIAAAVVAVIVMIILAKPISEFVERHPTIKILALSFLLLIGISLVVEAFEGEIPRGYIYFAMAFSVFVEMLNIRYRKNRPVDLHGVSLDDATEASAE
ncbi:MAG: hypothetical protein GY788_11395 [bacterium]|nr:hypothetical protein [bacterium]